MDDHDEYLLSTFSKWKQVIKVTSRKYSLINIISKKYMILEGREWRLFNCKCACLVTLDTLRYNRPPNSIRLIHIIKFNNKSWYKSLTGKF